MISIPDFNLRDARESVRVIRQVERERAALRHEMARRDHLGRKRRPLDTEQAAEAEASMDHDQAREAVRLAEALERMWEAGS